MLDEFKKFAMRGNVIDLAVGLIIGTAFGKIVSSMVQDIIMPPIGLLLGNVDFSGLFINLSSIEFATLKEAQAAGAPTINYGIFINHILDFMIVAFAIFMVIKVINRLKREEEKPSTTPAPTTKNCPECLSEIPLAATRCKYCSIAVKLGA